MDKIKYVKLEQSDGSYSDSIPLAVDSDYVDVNGNTLTNELNNKATKDEVQAVASGSPAGVYATVTALTEADPDHSRIYVVSADGHWYYYGNSQWNDGGPYQAISLENNSIKKEKLNNDIFEKDIISFSNIELNSNTRNSFGKFFYFNCTKNKQHVLKIKGNFNTSENVNRVVQAMLVIGDSISNDGTNTNTIAYEVYSLNAGETSFIKEFTFTPTRDYKYLLFQLSTNAFTNIGDFAIENIEITVDDKLIELINYATFPNDVATYDFNCLISNTKQVASVDYVINLIKNMPPVVKYNEITVSSASELKNAIDAIATDKNNNKANYYNRFKIFLNAGIYELYNVLDLSDIHDQQLFKRGLEIPDFVDLIGKGNVTIQLTLPNNIENEIVQAVSVLNTYGENFFENIKTIANNCRYCIHDDDGGPFKNRKIDFKNCEFKHNGNTINSFGQCYGAGYTGGRHGKFKNCVFDSEKIPFYVHSSSDYYMTDLFTLDIDNCIFKTINNTSIDIHDPYEATNQGIISINNSKLDSKLLLRGTNPFKIFGGGNNNFIVDNQNLSNNYII